MNKKGLISGAIALLLLSGCGLREFSSSKVKNEIVIDGDDRDWEGERIFCEKEGIIVGFQHDESNLYVLFISKEEELQRQMLQAGFTLWLNDEGKKKKGDGLYVSGLKGMDNKQDSQKNRRGERGSQQSGREEMSAKMRDRIAEIPEFYFLVDKDDARTAYSHNELKGFDFAQAMGSRGIVYEIKIPFTSEAGELYSFESRPGKTVAIGLECLAPEQNKDEMSPERSGGGGGMGGRGMGGGGRGMGGGSRGMGGGNPARNGGEDYKYWIKINLAEG